MSADPMTGLHDQVGQLGVSLAQWSYRATAADQAAARQAGSTAIESVDSLIRQLYKLRGQLVREIRADDDEALIARNTGGEK